MKNFIKWFEIPATDFARACTFYNGLLEVELETIEVHGTRMGMLPTDGSNVSGAIVHGDDYQPASSGTCVYLDGGEDLQPVLDRVEGLGGKIIVPKTEISEEMGYFALFIDTEGNKIGLHSNR